MKPTTTAPAEKIFACYMEYIHAEEVIAITNPNEETLIAPIVDPLVEAQADVLPVYQQAVQQCQVVHQMLEDAHKKYEDNDAIICNMYRSHWFMGLLYCKINLLDKAKAHYTAAIQTQEKGWAIGLTPISYACLAYVEGTDPRADTCKTESGKIVIDKLQYDNQDFDTFYWENGTEYGDTHYAICKVLSQQQVAPKTILQALQVTSRYMMISYRKDEEFDKLAIVAKVLSEIDALLSDETAINSASLGQVIKDLFAIYRLNLNPTDEYKDLQEAYQNCLELRKYSLHPIYQEATFKCAIKLGEYAGKEGDKQSVHTYFTAAYNLQVECEELDIDPDNEYDLPDIDNLAESLAGKLEQMKMYDEAIEFYEILHDLGGERFFEVANLYLLLNRLDDALAYYHTGKVYAEVDRDMALKIDQITSILQIEENPEVVRAYRERFYAHCVLPVDSQWTDLSNNKLMTYSIWEGETRIGYCCIYRWYSLREYYIDEAYQHKMAEILRQMVEIKLLDQVLLSSTQTPAYTVCKSESHYCKERHVYYAYSGKANAEQSALDMQLAREEDLEKIKKKYSKSTFFSRSKDVWADMIKRGEVYLYIQDNELIAVGECSADDAQPEVAKMNIGVREEYRQQGLATRILPFLVDKAIEQGKCPIINVEATYYIDAVKKLAEKCGFESRAMIVDMGLKDVFE